MPEFKPKLRDEYDMELRASLARFVEKELTNSTTYPFKSCLNCMHWNEKDEVCKLYNIRPPAKVIVYACEQYVSDPDFDIPF